MSGLPAFRRPAHGVRDLGSFRTAALLALDPLDHGSQSRHLAFDDRRRDGWLHGGQLPAERRTRALIDGGACFGSVRVETGDGPRQQGIIICHALG